MKKLRLSLLCFLVMGLTAESRGVDLPIFDGEHAMDLLRKQVEFGPRVPNSEAADQNLNWMMKSLRPLADRLTPHSFRMTDPYDSESTLRLTNVWASFRPELSQRFALAAHWDCRPRAEQDPDSTKQGMAVDGANDAASGVAVLMTLAEILAERAPEVGIDLLFFDGEDWGREGDQESYCLGSQRFVRDFPTYRPQALILLDMVGGRDLRITMEGASMQAAPELSWKVFNIAAELGLPAFVPIVERSVFDDHIPFLRAGIPAIDLIDLDYPSWHTTEDLPDKCAAESLEQLGRLLVRLVYRDFANWGF